MPRPIDDPELLGACLSALINRLVVRSATMDESWEVLVPDDFSPLGFSWMQDFPTRGAAFEAFSVHWGFDEPRETDHAQ